MSMMMALMRLKCLKHYLTNLVANGNTQALAVGAINNVAQAEAVATMMMIGKMIK
jgi:hypothetical protein